MKNPNVPKLGLIFTTKWQWSYVMKGGGAAFFEIGASDREARLVRHYNYIGFRIVRNL